MLKVESALSQYQDEKQKLKKIENTLLSMEPDYKK